MSPVGELDPLIATLQGSTAELLQFTVLGIIDKVMLVLHRTTNETYIMKVRTISLFFKNFNNYDTVCLIVHYFN